MEADSMRSSGRLRHALAMILAGIAFPAHVHAVSGSSSAHESPRVVIDAAAPVLSPAMLTFPPTAVGRTSPPQSATLTNQGTTALAISKVSVTYAFGQTSDCPPLLAIGASCTVQVTYAPHAVYEESGLLSIDTDAASEPLTTDLQGSAYAGIPLLETLLPAIVDVRAPPLQFSVRGAGFVPGAYVKLNGAKLPSTFLADTGVEADLPPLAPGEVQISAFNPGAQGGTSDPLALRIYRPVPYSHVPASYAYRDFAGANLRVDLSVYPIRVALPFPVLLGFTQLWASANGTLTFSEPQLGFWTEPLPSGLTPTLVAPFWDHLFGYDAERNVYWGVLGDAPHREIVFEWRDVGYCCVDEPAETVRFQVVFFEGSPEVLFNYADVHFGGFSAGGDAGNSASIGVQLGLGRGTRFSYQIPSLHDGMSILWKPRFPGDVDGDYSISIADVFSLINVIFAGSVPLGNGDANGDGEVDIADVFYLINTIFAAGPPPVQSSPPPSTLEPSGP